MLVSVILNRQDKELILQALQYTHDNDMLLGVSEKLDLGVLIKILERELLLCRK